MKFRGASPATGLGQNEIVQIVSSIGKSYSNYRELREAAAELEEQPNRSPATSAVPIGGESL